MYFSSESLTMTWFKITFRDLPLRLTAVIYNPMVRTAWASQMAAMLRHMPNVQIALIDKVVGYTSAIGTPKSLLLHP